MELLISPKSFVSWAVLTDIHADIAVIVRSVRLSLHIHERLSLLQNPNICQPDELSQLAQPCIDDFSL
jgi:hypothetical protein